MKEAGFIFLRSHGLPEARGSNDLNNLSKCYCTDIVFPFLNKDRFRCFFRIIIGIKYLLFYIFCCKMELCNVYKCRRPGFCILYKDCPIGPSGAVFFSICSRFIAPFIV